MMWRERGSRALVALIAANCLLVLAPAASAARSQQAAAPKSQVPDRGRPTTPEDALPLFEFERYFSGAWTFEWDVPEGVLGPEGTIAGRTTYRHLEGPFYTADTQASGPEGSFTVHELIAYQKEAKTATRTNATASSVSAAVREQEVST
jgi:hypothetical protein